MYNSIVIIIYTSPGCASCRKVKNYLKNNNLPFKEKNIFNTLLNDKEIKYIISRTENGTDDIISKRSKLIQKNNIDIDSMQLNDLCNFIVQNPSILRRPIIIDDKNLQIGYDSEEIEVFNKVKKIAECDKTCSHYNTCGLLREDIE